MLGITDMCFHVGVSILTVCACAYVCLCVYTCWPPSQAELTSCSDTDYDTRSHSSDSSLSNDECDVTHTTHSHSAHSVLSPAGRTPPRVPRRWAKGYNRRNILRSRRGIRAGDEVR